jgi:hypothetical protein
MKLFALACLAVATVTAGGCIPDHDYEGEYEMTYDVILDDDVVAGITPVAVRHGLNTEYLVDLGASFCQLSGSYIAAETFQDQPYMELPPQDCYFTRGSKTYPLSLTGTATYTDGEERFAIVLAGSFLDATDQEPGSATVELTERW